MKVRKGFVSNSSSSSFVIIRAGEDILCHDGSESEYFETEYFDVDIDDMIRKLMDAKAAGHTTIEILHGGGYDG